MHLHNKNKFNIIIEKLTKHGIERGPVCFEDEIEDFVYYTGIRAVYWPRNFQKTGAPVNHWLEKTGVKGCVLSPGLIKVMNLENRVVDDVFDRKLVSFSTVPIIEEIRLKNLGKTD